MTTRARKVRRHVVSMLLLRHATDFEPFTAYDVVGWWEEDRAKDIPSLREIPSIRTIGKILPGLNIDRLDRDSIADPIFYRLKADENGSPIEPYILCLNVQSGYS